MGEEGEIGKTVSKKHYSCDVVTLSSGEMHSVMVIVALCLTAFQTDFQLISFILREKMERREIEDFLEKTEERLVFAFG